MSKTYDTETIAQVQNIKRGEFVRRLNADGTAQSKTYQRSYYVADTKRYALDDVDDTSRQVFVRKGTKLLVGFTY